MLPFRVKRGQGERLASFQNARRFWYSLLHQNAAAALSVSISPEGSAVFWIKCFRPTPAPRSQKIPKMKILGVGGLENYLCIIQISAIGLSCRSDRNDYGGSIRKEKGSYKHTPLPDLTERTRMPHNQRYAQRWYNYPMKNKAP